MGLREQIKQANSESEISTLLSKGKSYEFASEVTQKAWKSTARFRLAELNNPVPAQSPTEKITPVKKSNKKSKNK